MEAWLERHPRFHLHFTPTAASWLNHGRDLLRAAHRQSDPPRHLPQRPDLIDAIETYLVGHNNNLQPFQWTATAEHILKKVRRGRVTLDAITN